MHHVLRAAMFFAVIAFAGFASPASAQSLSPAQKQEVQGLIREYLRQHPEVVQEAIEELKRRRQAELNKKILAEGRDFSVGPTNAKVTIVEFFDYRCPYCHAAMDWVMGTLRAHPRDVRVVFKELPVLGPNSVEASQAALAAIRQGKYLPFHRALMGFRGDLNTAAIDRLAKAAGMDVTRMRRDMQQPALFKHLEANHELAAQAEVNGTPAFLINGQWVRGWDKDEADRVLAQALRR
jgi:protein-disulfide isomerase